MWNRLILSTSVLTIFILFAVEFVVLGSTSLAYSGEYPDPFDIYTAIGPGQPAAVLRNYSCAWQQGTSVMTANCEIVSQNELFEKVIVSLGLRDAEIRQLMFSVDGLYLGDLVLLWGNRYSVTTYGQDSLIVRWHVGASAHIRAVGDSDQYGYWLPVISVSMR